MKYLILRYAKNLFAGILEVFWPILSCTSLSYLINPMVYMRL